MSTHVKVPAVGESISSGVVSAWHQQEGASVAIGDLLFTLDTDKVSTEVTAIEAGILKRLVEEGAEVKIGEIVAEILEAPASAQDEKTPKKKHSEPKKEKTPEPQVVEAISSFVEKAPVVEKQKTSEPVFSAKPSPEGRVTRRKLTPLRRKIAAQLVSAQQTAAILTTFNEVDMAPIMALRKEIQESFQKRYGVKLGFMSFFIKAVVEALQAVPSINARLEEEELIENHYYDIGVAVGTEKGLIVPVVRDCEKQSLAALEQQLIVYAAKAREGKIALTDLQGGVFTISNGGVYGSLLSTPILNPPQSGILGMHKIQERPVVVDGQIVIRPMMYLALSYDHRLVDGKEAVAFLIKVKEVLENPLRLFLA
ncbi:MAG: dihydrolipoyllysine-residue succinyltransferase [Chthoniobacterales bacterium]